MSTDLIEIKFTSGSIDEARKICRFLVQQRLVACSQITPWVESIYMWNNQLETTQESVVFLKTKKDYFDAVKQVILENHSYDIPEIIFSSIDGGNKSYLDWVQESIPEGIQGEIK